MHGSINLIYQKASFHEWSWGFRFEVGTVREPEQWIQSYQGDVDMVLSLANLPNLPSVLRWMKNFLAVQEAVVRGCQSLMPIVIL